MHVIDGVEIRALSKLCGPLLNSRRTFGFFSSASIHACFDGTWGGPDRWPARGLMRPA